MLSKTMYIIAVKIEWYLYSPNKSKCERNTMTLASKQIAMRWKYSDVREARDDMATADLRA